MSAKRFEEIANSVRERIRSRVLTAGDLLPSGTQLAQDWSVSKATIGRAVAKLKEEGLVETVPGAGIRVVEQVDKSDLARLYRGVPIPENVSIYTDDNGTRVVTRRITMADGTIANAEHRFPDALEHLFVQRNRDEPIKLYVGDFRFADGSSESETYSGHVNLRWRPLPKIEAEGGRTVAPDIGDLMEALDGSGDSGWTAKPWVTFPSGPEVAIPPDPDAELEEIDVSPGKGLARDNLREMVMGGDVEVERVTFGVANGWESYDTSRVCNPVRPWQFRDARAQVTLRGEYRAIFDALSGRRQILDDLKRYGGTQLTHVGELRRIDGSTFTLNQAIEVLDNITHALWISTGRLIDCVLPAGFLGEATRAVGWKQPRVDDYRSAHSMLDASEASDQLMQLIALCDNYCQDPAQKNVLHYAARYYLAANRGSGVELAVSQAVSGLQLLAYYRFVTDRGMTKNQFEKNFKRTEDEIKALLDDCKVPTSTPAHLTYLVAAGKSLPTPSLDGLHTIIKMRDTIIHPTRRTPDEWDFYQWTEAFTLAREFLLLAMLNLVGYNGRYRSLVATSKWVGTLDTVPWAP